MGDGKPKVGIILVGHGQLPKDLPQDLRHEYLSLKHKRRKPPEEEAKLESLERIVLEWPRNDSNDPYAHSLKLLAEELRRMGEYDRVWVAFNEFCRPTLEEALEEASSSDVDVVVVSTTMTTRGGEHAEKEIPEVIEEFRRRNPSKKIIYAWPFDTKLVAKMLVETIEGYILHPMM